MTIVMVIRAVLTVKNVSMDFIDAKTKTLVSTVNAIHLAPKVYSVTQLVNASVARAS